MTQIEEISPIGQNSPARKRFFPSLQGIAERQARKALAELKQGQLDVVFPNGDARAFGMEESLRADITIHDSRLFRRALTGRETGLAESYMDGDWDSGDLTALLRVLLRNEPHFVSALPGGVLSRVAGRVRHLVNRNSLSGSRKNIAYHYDLGNAFYGLWLDKTMTYSAALYEGLSLTLAEAQNRKYDRIAEWAEIGAGDRILEVGCGWGGFAERACLGKDAHIQGLTLSKEQWVFARERAIEGGFTDRSQFLLQDYRDSQGKFDAVVSIEMFEAVGEAYWNQYFTMLKDRLKPGAPAVLQVITIDEDRFKRYRRGADFIQRYIFPGGFLPTISKMRELGLRHGLEMEDNLMFGMDYARTLLLWRKDFEENWPALEKMGFDERFRRMWRFYLCYCEAGFLENSIDVGLFKFRQAD
ncbi:SAM-dependent methyltransferase [Aestuariispira insulae]|uniref:Cyclopropane-fatty-acyl-phospholipid synthase n=1 Tax=Aestuariispira insulae TaxID=1461337 RepID=A0A3D9H9D8_9PROT|nr:cyclopropane-fatty-acyl-phospholipid synthase family protein [Aestuariispira insulae]RED45791.1 cyclopropane-fatty-acyl-phospholipid synthase [Aestuariispira insulae]